MNIIKKYLPAFASALLMYLVLFIIYPHYQYYIDPDGISYLTISQRYAQGDYATAINGYWSPWSCWLTAALIRIGLAVIPASVVVNAIGATSFLLVSQSFFLKFNIIDKLQWLLCGTLAIFLCYAVFWQSFDDLWECFFLLSSLRVIIDDRFKSNCILWVSCGALGSLAYFAKAYSFPFFIVNTLFCSYFICINNPRLWARISIVSIGIMLLCAMPWVSLLHDKYGIWTTSTAGTLNTSWYLAGHPYWKPGIEYLIPPAYPGSANYWEDPFLANGYTPHFWNSGYLFGLQVLRIAYNVLKFFVSALQLSALFPLVGFIAAISLGLKFGVLSGKIKIVIISALIFPLGYLLINFESRYIWYLLPLGMLIGALLIQTTMAHRNVPYQLLLVVFPLSFLVYPLWCMRHIYDGGKQEYVWAQQLKNNHIQGSFACISRPGPSLQSAGRLAYFSGCNYYTNIESGGDQNLLLAEMRRYHVKYYFTCSQEGQNAPWPTPLADEKGVPFPQIKEASGNGLTVYQISGN